jgi:hypothetical protein
MKLKTFALAIVLLGAPSLAFSHAAKTGEHGGAQTDAGGFHVEVVAKDKVVEVYLNTHASKPVDTTGFKGVAIFKAVDGKPVRIPLEATGDNKLSGVAASPLPADLEGAVQITTQTGGVAQGKFAAHDRDQGGPAEHDHVH